MDTFEEFKGENRNENNNVLIRPLPQTGFEEFNLKTLIRENLIKVCGILVILALFLGYSFGSFRDKKISTSVPIRTSQMVETPTTTTESLQKIKVYVTGGVNNPGVVELASQSRIEDAIENAGGASPNADLLKCNLAAFVIDGSTVIVPEIGVAHSISCTGQTVQVEDASGGDVPDISSKISLNNSTQSQLETLPGVGPTLAGAIINYRKSNGSFSEISDLRKVKGIGEKRYDDLKDLVEL